MEFQALYGSVALTNFPHFVINKEIESGSNEYFESLRQILLYYYDYKKGEDFFPEGSNGDYVPSNIKFRQIKGLIDKESRFMFSQMPDINISSVIVSEEKRLENYKKVINKIIEKTKISGKLLEASKDCFIGGRVGCVVDFSERNGVGIRFYDALHFYYETDYSREELTKFITFEDVSKTKNTNKSQYLVNRYEREGDKVKMSSILYSSSGTIIKILIPESVIEFDHIPAVVILNNGLSDDIRGVSDIEDLKGCESGYNLLGNGDIDSERKNMNPVYVLVDMNHETTKNLGTSAGSVWDLESSMIITEKHPQVTKLSPDMGHVEAVKTTLERIKGNMYSVLDIPDISVEGMLSGITSYKAIRALYFPLSVRCDEKLTAWIPELVRIFEIAVDFCKLNIETVKRVYEVEELPKVQYKIMVEANYALLADENEEKDIDLDEVNALAKSRYSYLKKWRPDLKTDEEIEEEILKIAEEQNMIDTLSANTRVQKRLEDEAIKEDVEKEIDDIGKGGM